MATTGTVIGAASIEEGAAETGTGAATELNRSSRQSDRWSNGNRNRCCRIRTEAKQTRAESRTAVDASAITRSDETEGS